jgi:hypothetical protein
MSEQGLNKNLDFGAALQALKDGLKIQREGWNGKGQFCIKAGGYSVPVDKLREGTHFTKQFIESKGQDAMQIAPHIDLWNAQNIYVPGWVPSQGDLFAEDWQIID